MIEIEDEEFLSQIAAAEADAIVNSASKRRKINIINNNESHTLHSHSHSHSTSLHPPVMAAEEEGAYTAALRGSKSLLWQQQTTTTTTKTAGSQARVYGNYQSDGGNGNGNGSGSCFKCGGSGHWARDCSVSIGGGSDPLAPEKACSCGSGSCLVLTANTEKNRGRKFYKCPLREENGGCGFFEWCDNNSSGATNMTSGSQNYASGSSFPDLPCPCGAGSCRILTAKTGKNIGQQFYRCPANQESSCGYFKWCNDQNVGADLATNAYNSKVSSSMYETSSKTYGAANSSSCFKCGKEGHWAKDCTGPSSNSLADSGARSASNMYETSIKTYGAANASSCFKCGKEGHWAKDCAVPSSYSPAADSGTRSASNMYETSSKTYGAANASSCFKCGKEGHWAKDCAVPSSYSPAADSGTRSASSGGGTCYKCSKPGHWARDCPSVQNMNVRQKW